MQKLERHQWEETSWERPDLSLNIAGIADASLVSDVKLNSQRFGFQQLAGNAKKKKSGTSDPRFKRIVTNDMLTEEIANEARKLSESFARCALSKEEHKLTGNESLAHSKNTKIPTFLMKKSSFKPGENPSKPICPSMGKTNDKGDIGSYKITHKNNGDNGGYDCDDRVELDNSMRKGDKEMMKGVNLQAYAPKKSVSDCTLQTKNTSLIQDDGTEDCTRVQSFTSATRLSKVDKWIREFRPNPEKRRSVITVIGQIQGKSFSAALNEINQRRKLAKELDKHALCEAIIAPPEKENERKNLMTKVDFVSPDGKMVCSARNVYDFRDSLPVYSLKMGKCEEYPFNRRDTIKLGQVSFKLNDQIPERDVPVMQVRKRKTKRLTRKSVCRRFDLEGLNHVLLDCMEKQKLVSALVLFCAIIFVVVIFSFNKTQILDCLNLGQPKRRSWYETIFR